MTEKHGRKPEKTPKTEDEKLDQALDQSFPASDPPAQTEPTVNVRSKKKPVPQEGMSRDERPRLSSSHPRHQQRVTRTIICAGFFAIEPRVA